MLNLILMINFHIFMYYFFEVKIITQQFSFVKSISFETFQTDIFKSNKSFMMIVCFDEFYENSAIK